MNTPRLTTKRALLTMAAFTAATATACSTSGSSSPETVTVTEAAAQETPVLSDEQATEEAQSDAAPATFDRDDPNFEFFNICEELTNEDLAPYGLVFSETVKNVDLSVPVSSCGFDVLEEEDVIQARVVAVSGISREQLENQSTPISFTEETPLQGVLVFTTADSETSSKCEAAVPTLGGMLWVSYGYFRDNVLSSEEICNQAIKHLEEFHSIMENQK